MLTDAQWAVLGPLIESLRSINQLYQLILRDHRCHRTGRLFRPGTRAGARTAASHGVAEQLLRVLGWVVADRGYSSHAIREHIWNLGARPAIPPNQNEAPVACPDWIYTHRNQVERL